MTSLLHLHLFLELTHRHQFLFPLKRATRSVRRLEIEPKSSKQRRRGSKKRRKLNLPFHPKQTSRLIKINVHTQHNQGTFPLRDRERQLLCRVIASEKAEKLSLPFLTSILLPDCLVSLSFGWKNESSVRSPLHCHAWLIVCLV